MSREAVEVFDKNIAVSAGAGSGKTTLLVERFLFAVTEKKFDPERILAITFTEKAANEMKARVIAECDKRGLDHLRQRLENSAISTIHSFCARLLRENPIESGVDPFFQILPEAEADLLMEKVMDALFEAQSENGPWLEILADYGEDAVRAVFRQFYVLSRSAAGGQGLLRSEEMAREKKELEGKIRDFFRRAPEELSQKPDFKTLSEIFSDYPPSNWETIQKVAQRAAALHKRGAHKDFISDLRDLLEEWSALAAQKLARPVKESFLQIFSRFKEAYEKEKESRASYDFEDLAFLAHKLLSGQTPAQKAVRQRLREFFSCILVDEYQDTSFLQAQLIGLLKKEDNLFVVGDVQQSIYGFRYADPEVFKAALSDGKIILSDNYRSRPEILEFINRFFSATFPQNTFEPLCSKRSFPSKASPSIEFLCVARDKEPFADLDKARTAEARGIARRILGLVESGWKYRDIGILFRNTSSLYLYEKELKDAGIPYFALRSRGFYEQPEIVDVVNFLKLVESPHHDIALAGVLRSPLVSISDNALFWLARLAKRSDPGAWLATALERLDEIPELEEPDRRKLLNFKSLLSDLRESKNRFKISEMIEAIFARTHAEAKALASPGGRQKLANLKKLVELARSVEQRSVVGVEDFVFFLKSLSEREVLEPQARTQSAEEDVATVLTVHAAKGLEFGCVIVADMGAQTKKNKRGNILALEKCGMGLRLRNPLDGEWVKDAVFQKIERHFSEKESAESDRLLYVAMTRAKEHLILSGVAKFGKPSLGGKEPSSWMEQVVASVALGAENLGCREMDWNGIRIGLLDAGVLAPVLERKSAPSDPVETFLGEKKFATDLKERLKPVLRDYPESWDKTVSDLWSAWAQGQKKGLPVFEPEEESQDNGEGEEGAPANEFGTIFHKLMELTLLGRVPKIPAPFFDSSWTQGLSGDQKKRLRGEVSSFWNSILGKALRKSKKRYPELSFIYKTPHGVLKGQIDLVFQTPQGEWVILDYKTNRLDPGEKHKLAENYSFQLALYALVFKKLYGISPARGILYFSSIGQSHEFAYQEKDFEAFEKMLDFWFLFCKNDPVLGGTSNGETRYF